MVVSLFRPESKGNLTSPQRTSSLGLATGIRTRPLVWLNVVCLDAPIVAVSWQWLFGRSCNVAVSAQARSALFLTAWFIYLIDRLADAYALKPGAEVSLREEFCLRHTHFGVGLALPIALLDAAVVLARLDRHLVLSGVLLSGVAVVYLGANFACSRIWETIPLKEIFVGLLFAAGTLLVFAAPIANGMANSAIALPAVLFAALCSLNCMSIAVWERDLDHNQAKHSIATRWPAVAAWVPVSCMMLAIGAPIIAIVDRPLWPLAACLSISAILLAMLHFVSIQRDERTALADLVLLTPVALFYLELLL